MGVMTMCRVLCVARAGFYAWQHNPVSERDKDNQRLLTIIRDSYSLSGGVYGYLVADSHLVQEMPALHWSLSRGTSGLLQQWVAELLKSGTYERHLRRMRTVYQHKRDYMVALVRKYLPDAKFSVPPGGLQLYVRFSEPEKTSMIYDWLSRNNIQITDTGNYTFDTDATSVFIVLGFANTDVNECKAVFERLYQTLSSGSDSL